MFSSNLVLYFIVEEVCNPKNVNTDIKISKEISQLNKKHQSMKEKGGKMF